MLHGTVKGGTILTALMLVAVCLSCMVPAFAGETSSETEATESVVIEIDTGDKTLAEIVVDYATASAEKDFYESMDRDAVIIVPDRPDMPGNAGHVMDRMDEMLDVRILESNAAQPDAEEAEPADGEPEVIQAGSTGVEPDADFIEEVLEYMESLGDESLDATVEALRAYLEASFVVELNNSLVRTLDDQRDEEPEEDGGPVVADVDEEEPETPFEPRPEPETPSAPCEAPVYRMGVTTSGLL